MASRNMQAATLINAAIEKAKSVRWDLRIERIIDPIMLRLLGLRRIFL